MKLTDKQFWKFEAIVLACTTFLTTTAILSIVLFCFVWDWNGTSERPTNIPPDEERGYQVQWQDLFRRIQAEV